MISVSGSENRTEASYRYQVDGVDYQGSRVYVAEFNDNIGSYHRNLQIQLDEYLRTGHAVPIWVNPLDPYQAVIDRGMRWGLFSLMSVFGSVFIFTGLVVAYFGLRTRQNKQAVKRPSLSVLRKEWKQKQQAADFNTGFTVLLPNHQRR